MFYRPETPPIRAVSFYTVIGSNYLGRRNPETNGVTFMEKLRQLIGRKAVLQLIGLKRTALDEAVARGDFPAPVKMFEGGRKGFWDREEVMAHIEARFAARKKIETKVTKTKTKKRISN